MNPAEITDDYMLGMLQRSRPFSIVILKKGPHFDRQSPLLWEHGRRNFALRADGRLAVVCPVDDGSDVSGIGIFTLSVDETRDVMEGDPGVQAGLFTFDVHAGRSFPGDGLPSE